MPFNEQVNGDWQCKRTARYTGYSADVTGSTAGVVGGTGNLGAAPTVVNADLKPGACLQLCAGSTWGSILKIAGAAAGSDVAPNDGAAVGRPIVGMNTPFVFVSEDWPKFDQDRCNTQAGVTANLRDGGPVPVVSGQTAKVLCLGTLYSGVTMLEPVSGQFYLQPCSRSSALYASVAASAAITNTNTATAYDKSYTVPANTLNVGDILRIRAQGTVSVGGSGTLQAKILIGTTVLGSTAAPVVATGDCFNLDVYMQVRTIGASGTLVSGGFAFCGTPHVAAAATDIPGGTFVASTAINTTTTNAITVTATGGVAADISSILNILSVEKIAASNMGLGPIAVAAETPSSQPTSTAALVKVRLLNPPT